MIDREGERDLRELLSSAGFTSEEALETLNSLLTDQLGFAKVDTGRAITSVMPEVVLAPGKSLEELIAITGSLLERSGSAIVSRVEGEAAVTLRKSFPQGRLHARARLFLVGEPRRILDGLPGKVAVVSAGTSDLHAADEAAVILEAVGAEVERVYDIGVAGIHRLGSVLPLLRECNICIVCAGMDAALPTVLGGLYRGPIIAVPTSTGYGTAFHGVTALHSMLCSCSPGISVVNIDNGLGAAAAALRILAGGRDYQRIAAEKGDG